MKVAPAGRFGGGPAAPASAMSVIMFPRIVIMVLRRGEFDSPSISTPARMTVTGTLAGVCAQLEENHTEISNPKRITSERFTATSGKAGLSYSRVWHGQNLGEKALTTKGTKYHEGIFGEALLFRVP